jgi:histidine phosphatase superfamily protein (branch 2)
MTYPYTRYDSAFGYPLSRALGVGYIQEMVARLTHTPIEMHNSSTNSTLDDNPITFPLDHNLYVDATHEVVILNSELESSHNSLILNNFPTSTCVAVITALNLSSFAAKGPLPTDHVPKHRSFRVSELAPFSTNVQFQRKS